MANFCAFRLKTNGIEIGWDNFKIYIEKSQCKIDFLSIFYPSFPDLCHFKQLWKIRPFFYNSFFGFGGGGEIRPTPAGAHASQWSITKSPREKSFRDKIPTKKSPRQNPHVTKSPSLEFFVIIFLLTKCRPFGNHKKNLTNMLANLIKLNVLR